MHIDVAKRFSPYPAGRFDADGSFNGTKFRQEVLIPAIKDALAVGPDETVIIDIDGVRSFGSSFLEEAFNGLVRYNDFPRDVVQRVLRVRRTKPHLEFFEDMILSYIKGTKVPLAS